jgi:hypothetical protein
MEDLLRSKGSYIIRLGTKTTPNDEENITKWDNENDEARGLIGVCISPGLRFHLDGLDSPIKAGEKLNTVFGIKNEIQFFQLENELLTLDPSSFPSI